ncbi:bifunctional DNA primase/helicase [Novosphingobium aquae]|uniref:Bifunctional DNA primase/helicase n=1 Tax=Novosphingobium aquae TaxID=3133435 RepID=A0ABU8S3Y3_9SPHN
MEAGFATKIAEALQKKFNFKKRTGKYWQQGTCPGCGKHTLWCHSENPRVLKCDRQDNCGYDDTVKSVLPELFEDWTKRAPATEQDPNATADAYLRYERGLDLTGLRGAFSQEWFQDRKRNIGSATVRFELPGGSWWERIIDRPGRFDKKANFKFGASYAGYCWMHPADSYEKLAEIDEIWVQEGIFDACMTRQCFPAGDAKAKIALRTAVSAMSTNNYPEHFLAELAQACLLKSRKDRPRLVFAYDVGPAGIKACRDHVKRARKEGWNATAAQVRPDGEGNKLDWNDLGLRHIGWKDEPEKAPFSEQSLDLYLFNGAVTIAETARAKALLIADKTKLRSFELRFGNKIYWAKQVYDKEAESSDLAIEEICNCDFRILYRERDEAADESNYFIRVDFPNAQPTAKARFTAACCSASGEFKKRLFAFSGMWSGSQEQLDRLMRGQTRTLKTVEPVHATGYSAAHNAWVLGDIAVSDGRVIPINKESYFEIGRTSVKLRTTERLLGGIVYDPDAFAASLARGPDGEATWLQDIWTAWGPRGFVTLAFWTASLFAQQIRAKHKSLGFLEITGPPGSGKSTLIEFLWRLCGRDGYEGFDPSQGTATGAARNFAKVANLPIVLMESKRENQKGNGRQFDYSELLTLYNGRSPRAIGVKNSGTETHEPPFLGSILLMQNERIDAIDAVLERLMSFPIDKAGWNEATRAAALRIESWPIEQCSGFIVHAARNEKAWLESFFRQFPRHEEAMPKRVKDLHNSRAIKCHSQLAAALDALKTLLPVRDEWIAETRKLIDWMALDRQQSSGADHPLVRRFWEQVEYLDSLETDEAERPLNQHRKAENGLIAINMSHFEDRARSRGLSMIDMPQLHKLLPHSKTYKFVAAKPVNCADGKKRHCWVFESPVTSKPVI